MIYSDSKLAELNAEFGDDTAQNVVRWAIENHDGVIATTHFGPHEAVILHMISSVNKDLPIVCVDHGYNTDETYKVAAELTERLSLKVSYFTPLVTRKRREAVLGGVPSLDDEAAHTTFTNEVKLEPFGRAFDQFQPKLWLTSLRKEQTQFRESLNILANDKKFNCLKVSPLFNWTELDLEEYLVENDLPFGEDYHDPTKVLGDRECGLHTSD